VVDPLQPTQKPDAEMIAVPKEIAVSIQEIVNLYRHHHKQRVIELLKNLIFDVKQDVGYASLENKDLVNSPTSLKVEVDDLSESEFLKSWDDIFNVQVYIDTDIFGELDARPPALKEADHININSQTVIQHTEATEAYVQSWKELAQSMSSFPDDLFTRLWTTSEIAKLLECPPSILRRARRKKQLPVKVKNLILDCISHNGERSLWFVRPE
jgi:hypothetical protein